MAPIIKNCFTEQQEGMIPIEKNIIVVDEQGNEYEAIPAAGVSIKTDKNAKNFLNTIPSLYA